MNIVKHLTGALGTALFITLAGAPAFAVEPGFCNPGEDELECECPQDPAEFNADTCSLTPIGNLIYTDDTTTLENYVSASWDSEDNVYDVTVDLRNLPGEGVMLLGSNAGQFGDLDEVLGFLSDVFGIQVDAPFDSQGQPYLLPPMRINQTGTSTRIDEATGTWAPENSHNFIADILTDKDGKMTIGSDVFVLFEDDEGCEGSDSKAQDAATDGALTGNQCSWGRDADYFDRTDSGDARCANAPPACKFIVRKATTVTEAKSTEFILTPALSCSIDEQIPYECDMQNGFIRNLAVEADIDSDATYFTTQGPIVNSLSKQDVPSVTNSDTTTGGTCTHGYVTRAMDAVQLQTRDGAYNSSVSACVF